MHKVRFIQESGKSLSILEEKFNTKVEALDAIPKKPAKIYGKIRDEKGYVVYLAKILTK